jgi:Ca2+-binding RTX toxin-like protein
MAITIGTADGETLQGTDSSDELYGLEGNDVLIGGDGDDLLDGGSGADVMEGGEGDDVYIVDTGYDRVEEADDGGVDEVRTAIYYYQLPDHVERLVGLADYQYLSGNDLDNEIWAGGAGASLSGGAGDDILHHLGGGGSASGGSGHDIVYFPGSLADYEVTRTGHVTINSVFVHVKNLATGETTQLNNVETVRFADGSQLVLAGIYDRHGSGGNDVLHGDNSLNYLYGYGGDDTIYGYGGSDWIDGGTGADTMIGGLGDEVYIIDNAGDVIVEQAGEGYDHARIYLTYYELTGSVDFGWAYLTQATTLIGSSILNVLTGNVGDDWLEGRGGDDILDGGAGADTMIGGQGKDSYNVDNVGDVIIEYAGGGIDKVYTALATYVLPANVENLESWATGAVTLTGNALGNRFSVSEGISLTLDGGGGHDIVDYTRERGWLLVDLLTGEKGGAAANDILISIEQVIGGQGNDVLRGTNAADTIEGGWGNDVMVGRGGNDIYLVDTNGDVVVEEENEGTDEIRIMDWIDEYALPANVERMKNMVPYAFIGWGNELNNELSGNIDQDWLYGYGGHDTLSGGGGDDFLYGGDGHDTLSGGTGADTMEGGDGYDVYLVDNAGDIVTELPGEGIDMVYVSLSAYTLPDEVENLYFNGQGAFAGTGNGLDNVINGSSGADILDGGGGNDELRGGSGADILLGGDGNDLLVGGSGADVLVGGAGADIFLFSGYVTGLGVGADRITDFTQGEDLIDLSPIDADLWTGGNQAFTFIAGAAFSGTAGELRFGFDGTDTWLQGDTDGDGFADFEIVLSGPLVPLAGDFFL